MPLKDSEYETIRLMRVGETFDAMMAAKPTKEELLMLAARPGLSRERVVRILAAERECERTERPTSNIHDWEQMR